MDKIDELLTRGVANIIPGKAELAKVLRSGKKLNVYLGIDPTATHIHLGHAVPLRKLQQFVELGHHVTFLIGDFTALVGDTSDKTSERPRLSKLQIEENFKTYKQQAEKILDFSRVTVRYNSEWLKKLGATNFIDLAYHFSLNDFISRELIKKRLESGGSVKLPEVLYPLLQGYDSLNLDTDVQVGGTDQTFNMQAGRTLLKDVKNKESFVITNGFLTGTDGRNMSKSWGDAIWLDDSPNDMYGKVMSIKDELIPEYFLLATKLPISNFQSLISNSSPMQAKKQLAHQIVLELHSQPAADAAQAHFESTVQAGELPTEVPEISVKSKNIVDVLVESGLASSKSEAKRLIDQKGVRVDNKAVSTMNYELSTSNSIVSVGSRKFIKIK